MVRKRIPRKVLFVTIKGKTNRGNPSQYEFLLGCGHVLTTKHSDTNWMIYNAVMGHQKYAEKHCPKCVKDEEWYDTEIYGRFGSAGTRVFEIHSEKKKLRGYMPREFFGGEYYNSKAMKHLDQVVVRKHNRRTYREQNIPVQLLYSRMPFKHKCMHVWWELENGYAVGWNENPSMGWSFPVKRLDDYVSVIK